MKTNLSKTGHLSRIVPAATLSLVMLSTLTAQAGIWTAFNNPPPSGLQYGLLLSDGTVMCADGGTGWYRLTPNSHGSYVNGTWTALASMNYSRLFFSSDVLTNGNVYVAGGEYGGGPAELYDTLANTWTVIQPPSGNFSDACSKILPNGNVLQSDSQSSYYIYSTASNTLTYGGSCEDMNESCWVRLPSDNILAVTGYSTTSEHYVPTLNAWYTDGDVPVTLFGWGGELGPAFVLPNGKVFQVGGTINTALYTPAAGLTSAGGWVAGPEMEFGTNDLGAVDAPGAEMITGNVLLCIGPTAGFDGPSFFYEYNYVNNSFIQEPAPGGGATYPYSAPFGTSMLCLPDGTVLFFAGQGTTSLYVYTPSGTPLAAGTPTISSLSQNTDGSYLLTGVGLNGITGGAAYGDDWQMDTSYPLVRLTNTASGNVYYARTHNWSSTTIQNPRPVMCDFSLPSGLPPGTYSLVVTVMGNVSAPRTFAYAPPPVPTGLTALAGNGQVTLSWNGVFGATAYNVKRFVPSNAGFYATVATVTLTNFTDLNLTNLYGYSYVVSAVSPEGESANSLPVTVMPQGPPSAPTGFSALSDTFGRITLSWAPSLGTISYYNIERSTTDKGPYTFLATSLNPFFTDSGLMIGQTYYYVVSAVNPYGASGNSAQVSAASESIANFGFEQPAYSGGEYNYDPTNGAWQFVGASPNGSGMLANGSAFSNPDAPEGVKAAFVQSNGTISQTLSGFMPGTTYVLTYSAAQRPGDSQTWNVMIDNTVIETNDMPGSTSYTDYSATFVATAPVHTLTFAGTDLSEGDDTIFLDNVAIWPAAPSYGGNFGFENPIVSGFQYDPLGGTWTFDGASPNGSGIVANGGGFGNPNAPQGAQAAFLQDHGVISQRLMNLVPGTLYTVSYLAAQRGPDNTGGQTWNVYIDSLVVQSNNVPGSTSYTPYSATFTATSSSQTLAFVGTDLAANFNTVFLDDVVIGVALQPLPPPSITLLGVTNGALMNYSSTINLSASVVANGNNVSNVEYLYDITNVIAGPLTAAPYNYTWNASLAGTHAVFARVFYNNGSHQDSPAAAVNFLAVWPATAVDVVGSQITFQSVFSGAGSPSYQWRKISGGTTNNISGATNSTLSLANLQLSNAGIYQLLASNAYGVVAGAPRSLTVNSAATPIENVIINYAAQTGLGGSNNNFYPTWNLASGSLIEGQAPSSIGTGDFSEPAYNQCGPVAVLTDGSIGFFRNLPGNGDSSTEVACGGGAGQSVTYTLTTTTNGYNLTNITVYGGWGDAGRDEQAYTISYAMATAPSTFMTLASVAYNPSDPLGVNSATRMTLTPANGTLASNVAALTFNFTTPPPENGYTGYSEIQVFGVSTLPPAAPPTFGATMPESGILVLNIEGLVVGRNYQVQSTTNLAYPLWVTETNFIATQTSAAITNAPGNSAQEFYRVVGF